MNPQQGKGRTAVKSSAEAIASATAVKIDAMTLLGKFLANGKMNRGGRPGKTGSKVEPVSDPTPTLAELGIGGREFGRRTLNCLVKLVFGS